jgi:tetratricopeptide (TPR) repeat protein
MRRSTFLLGLSALIIGTTQLVVRAEPPHLDLVRGLRKEGLSDLAMEYLDRLKTSTDPEVKTLLPLETARTRLDLASQESDERKRAGILLKARAEFDSFIKQNAQHPLVATANIELARLISLQGKQILVRARRAESEDQAKVERLNARPLFQEATKRFDEAAKQIDANIKKSETDSSARGQALLTTLTDAKVNAELDRAINLYNLGQTYSTNETKEIVERGKWINDAKKIFTNVAYRDSTTTQAFIARAWEAQCSHETQTGTADKEFASLFEQKAAVAIPGVRLGKAFRVKHAYDDTGLANRLTETQRRGLDWVKEFPSAGETPEGILVRYHIALSQLGIARVGITRNPQGEATAITPVGLKNLQEAENRFREIADGDNEYSERAGRRRMECILDRTDATRDRASGETRPEDMKNFQDAYIQALVTQARLPAVIKALQEQMNAAVEKAPEADKEKTVKQWTVKLAKEEEENYQKLIDFLNRAVEIAKPTDSKKDLLDARVLMAYHYQLLKQYDAAAVMAEHIFRTAPDSPQLPAMGRLAVVSYLNAMNQYRKAQQGDSAGIAGDAKRVKLLGAEMEKRFPTDPATDPVRHSLAFINSVEKNYPEALRLYSTIQPSYSDIRQARLEQGSVLYLFVRSFVSDEAKGQQFTDEIQAAIQKPEVNPHWQKTLADLGSLPAPDTNAALDDITEFSKAKSQLALLYQLEGKQYQRMEEIGNELAAYFEKASVLDATTKSDFVSSAVAIRMNGTQGKAFLIMKGREPEYLSKAAALLDPVIDEFKKTSADPMVFSTPGGEKMRRASKEIITLALRASVQDAKIDRARELLDLLQQAKSETEDTTQVLQQLVNTIRAQIDSLKTEKKVEEADKLVKSFSDFIDTVAKQVAKEMPKNPQDEQRLNSMKLFLARGFSSVDLNQRAAELMNTVLESLPAPATDEQKRFKIQVQYAVARYSRLSTDFKKAETVLTELIGDPKTRGPGYSSLEIRKERALLLEDQKNFKGAIAEWQTLIRVFVGELPALPPDVKEGDSDEERQKKQAVRNAALQKRRIYFDLFFETYRASARAYENLDPQKYATQKAEGMTKAAQKFVELEVNTDISEELKEKVRDTFEKYPTLKEKYIERGGKVFLPPMEKK